MNVTRRAFWCPRLTEKSWEIHWLKHSGGKDTHLGSHVKKPLGLHALSSYTYNLEHRPCTQWLPLNGPISFLPCHIGLLIQALFNTYYIHQALFYVPYMHQFIQPVQQPHKVVPLPSLFFRWRHWTDLGGWWASPKFSQPTSERTEFQTWFCLASESLFLDITLAASGGRQATVTGFPDLARKT